MMIWYNMKWNDLIWNDTKWYDMIWSDTIWCDMIWYDTIWCDMIWYKMIWNEMKWNDMKWNEMIWLTTDMIWHLNLKCNIQYYRLVRLDLLTLNSRLYINRHNHKTFHSTKRAVGQRESWTVVLVLVIVSNDNANARFFILSQSKESTTNARSSRQFFWMFFLDAITLQGAMGTLQWHHVHSPKVGRHPPPVAVKPESISLLGSKRLFACRSGRPSKTNCLCSSATCFEKIRIQMHFSHRDILRSVAVDRFHFVTSICQAYGQAMQLLNLKWELSHVCFCCRTRDRNKRYIRKIRDLNEHNNRRRKETCATTTLYFSPASCFAKTNERCVG